MHSNVKPCNPDFTACAIGFHPSPKPINKCPRDQALVNCFDYYVPFLLIIRYFLYRPVPASDAYPLL